MNKFPFDQRKVACLDIHSPLYLRTKEDKYGGGDISDLYQLIDRAADAGFRMIQFNPINDSISACPYFSISAFSFNPIHISLDLLWQSEKERENYLPARQKNGTHEFLHYKSLYSYKIRVLKTLFQSEKSWEKIDFSEFDKGIIAYALFKTLKEKFKSNWSNWPREYKKADVEKILENHPELHKKVKFYLFVQQIARVQWNNLSKYAESKKILLVFDKPIYPIHDSADVWANQSLFYLYPDGTLKYEAGCNNPRDPFGPQRWGNAVYRFKEKPDKVIEFFLRSVEHLSKIGKIIRLDHALALVWKYYIIDPETKKGTHLPALKHKLFNRLLEHFPDVYFFAEDVGYVSKKNIDLPLQKHNIPGIRCLQWTSVPKYTKLMDYPELSLAMTSNHDTPSLPSWWKKISKAKKKIFYHQLDNFTDEENVSTRDIIHLVFNAPSKIASVTLRDITGDLRRYNTPGKKNYRDWRYRSQIALEEIDFDWIARIIKETGRSE